MHISMMNGQNAVLQVFTAIDFLLFEFFQWNNSYTKFLTFIDMDMLGMSDVGSVVPENAWKTLAVIFSFILSDGEGQAGSGSVK